MRIGLDLTLKSALKTGPSDVTAPTVVITLSDYALKIGDTATVTFAFSEAPVGFAEADVTAPNGSLSSFGVTGDPLVYTAIFTPDADISDATNVITVGTGWTDAAGNPPAGATNSANYEVDTVAPTCTITCAQISPSAAATLNYTITFSKPMTGFELAEFVIVNGTKSALGGSGAIYTCDVTPTAIGNVTANVAAGVATDGAGNQNTIASQLVIFATTQTAPAITPSLGSELITNPGFEGTYEDESSGGGGTVMVAPNWNNSGCETNGTDTLNESATAHGGSKSQLIIVDTGSEGIGTFNNCFGAIGWYQLSAWFNITSGTAQFLEPAGEITASSAVTGSWVQVVSTGRITSANRSGRVRSSGGGANFLVDDVSGKAITFSSMRSLLGTTVVKNGTYICHPTLANATQCGILLEYLDDNNFVLLNVNRVDNTAKLVSRIAGTYAVDKSGAITYVAGAELKCVVSGTTHRLFYNGSQVGTDATIVNSGMGLQVHGFNALAGNTVGVVTVNP